MTQRTIEQERINAPTDSFVAVAERVPTNEEIVEMAEQWTNDPAERIASQLDELAVLYDGRTDRTTFYDFQGRNHQYEVFATRDAAGEQLEEVYTILSSYSALHGHTKAYSVTVLDVDGRNAAYRLSVTKGELAVFQGMQPVHSVEERDRLVADFLYRSLVATVRTTERSFEAREDADLDALIKLERRLYDGRRKVVARDE
jgi:hypothetical protein